MANEVSTNLNDLLPIKSRVSWGAVFAGAVTALTFHFVLLLLGTAIGLTVDTTSDVSRQQMGVGAAVWAAVATALSLFIGGWVTSQAMVGEGTKDAIVHGIIMWGVVFAMILWLVGVGIRGGFNAIVGLTNTANAVTDSNWKDAARRAGVSAEQIDTWEKSTRDATSAATQSATAEDREAATKAASQTAWWSLGGTLLSVAAAIIGAIVGAGGKYRLLAVGLAREGGQMRTAPR